MLVGKSYSVERSQLLGREAAVSVLRLYGDKWRYTAAPDWWSKIPTMNISDVFKIIEKGSATLDSMNHLKATTDNEEKSSK